LKVSRNSENDTRLGKEDAIILEIIQQICRRLNISQFKYNPYRIEWRDSHGQQLLAHNSTIDPSLIILQENARGKLDPFEWEVLITADLIYRFKLRKQLLLELILSVGLPVLGGVLFFAFIVQYLFSVLGLPSIVYSIGYFSLIAVLWIGFGRLGGKAVRRVRQISDERTAEIFGTSRFLETLRKIESLNVTNVDRIKERIRHILEAQSTLPDHA